MISKNEYKILQLVLKNKEWKINNPKTYKYRLQLFSEHFLETEEQEDQSLKLKVSVDGERAIEEYKSKHRSSKIALTSLFISLLTFISSVVLPIIINLIK